MANASEGNVENELYEQGMKYNWRQEQSPANSAISWAAFERAAYMGHTKAMRELAEMMFVGSGGVKNEERALGLKWAAFVRGDIESLDELSALLASYAETASDELVRKRAVGAARQAEEAFENLGSVGSFVSGLLRSPN